MRRYIRHPSAVPIHFSLESGGEFARVSLHDASQGGLCFTSKNELEPGSLLHLQIPISRPPFEVDGMVVWCRPEGRLYLVGLRFHDPDTAFAVRMVEQVCHIEQYRRHVAAVHGRQISSELAATEWIQRHAARFPSLDG